MVKLVRKNAKAHLLFKGDGTINKGLPDTIKNALGASAEELRRQEAIKKQLEEAEERADKKYI